MAEPITVPRLGWSMEEGTFVGWLKQDGDSIQAGVPLFVLESEKAAEEIEAIDTGILRIPPDGPKPYDKVKVGQVLAYLVAQGEVVPATQRTPREVEVEEARPSVEPVVSAPATTGRVPGKPTSSPRARRAAAELGIDWTLLPGSGRNGRIRERDVRTVTGRSEGQLFPLTPMRRTIAARMIAGCTQAAPVTLTTRADATNLVNLRTQFRAAATARDDLIPTYTDLILKLAASALRQHPMLQAQWRENGLFVPHRIDIAIAVDTETGLLAPAIREADKLTLRQVAAQSRDLIATARAGQLTADQMRDATFTITNLGSFGIEAFTPIISLPQCAILGIGCIVREPILIEDRIVPGDRMTLSLTFDHRIVDGAPAARFLGTLRGCLEQPAPWLLQ